MNDFQALIIDDEPDIRELLTMTLEQMGLTVYQAANVAEARDLIDNKHFDFCLTDMRLPDGDGLELVSYIQQHCADMPVAVITAHGSADHAVEALKKGAFDFVSKPVQLKRLRTLVQTALELRNKDLMPVIGENQLTGNSPLMTVLRQQINRVTRSQAPVFISGESGTGKELVARAIHYNSPRAKGPFIPVNCGAIPAELMESEFFGHLKGSFTGAIQDKQGLFQAADGGTLFLDEVADLPLAMQVKLLRAIQEKSVRPIGSQEEKTVDVRILSATHKNLSNEIYHGNFREDLFYRINVIEISVPALRKRSEDIPALVELFINRFSKEVQIKAPELSSDAINALQHHTFPGNVRELENTLERAFTLCENGVIHIEDLNLRSQQNMEPIASEKAADSAIANGPVQGYTQNSGVSIDDYLADLERQILTQALEENRWNKTGTAVKLGISFRQLRYKLKKLGID